MMTTHNKLLRDRTCWVEGATGRTLWNGRMAATHIHVPKRVRVVDARKPPVERAVAKLLQKIHDDGKTPGRHQSGQPFDSAVYIQSYAKLVGMTATIDAKGRVRAKFTKRGGKNVKGIL